ncbi:MAG: FMN-binding protein [Fibrobacter sp.]|nr:FMN-binding protein [Fibrobacter sp.]
MNNITSSLKIGLPLAILAAISGLLIVVSHLATEPTIKAAQQRILQESAVQVIPQAQNLQLICSDGTNFKAATDFIRDQDCFFAGQDSAESFNYFVLNAQGQGFADKIQVLYGYDLNRATIIGFLVLESKETPGLGDKIAFDPAFLDNFKQLATQPKIEVVKQGQKTAPHQIDGITGATISSVAIGDILRSSVEHFTPILQEFQELNHGK